MSNTTPESKAGRVTMTMAGNLKMKDCILISPLPTGIMVGAFVTKVLTHPDAVEVVVATAEQKRIYSLNLTDCVPVIEF